MGVRMLPKYGHQKNLTPLAGALMIFADCYGVAARGLQSDFSGLSAPCSAPTVETMVMLVWAGILHTLRESAYWQQDK